METNEKRKEKPKRNNRRFLGLSIFLTMVLLLGLAGIFTYVTRSIPQPPAFYETSAAIELTNQQAFTEISASATQAAIATNSLEVTATALDDWSLATPSPNP